MPSNFQKALQKQAYDIVSHRYGLLIVIGAIALVTISAFHFGETVLEWSEEKYAAVFNSYSDNLAGKSFRERLCLPVPIDVVYTWVNGSDPKLINQLRKVKLDMEEELNITREEKCTFTNCLKTNMVILEPPLPKEMTLEELSRICSTFKHAQKLFPVTSNTEDKLNFSVVAFPDTFNMSTLQSEDLVVNELNVTIRSGYITTDWTVPNSILMSDVIIMAGIPSKYSLEELKDKLPNNVKNGVDKMELHSEEGLVVMYVPQHDDFNRILAANNFSFDGKEPTLNAANLFWDLRDFRRNEDVSASRFEDNEELRYSLRSIDRFAPWVRHIYIITNGQIPYWLNMEHPRVTVVTHEDLFPNKTHLPTFSSPAIEAHVHRIPGLSKRFIYLNDDVMFGKEVWPDDFYTFSGGQKVYLTWPVPNCQDGCPTTWIKDGYCDKACNNSECEWDGGDCTGDHVNQAAHWQGGVWQGDAGADYCYQGCPNSWLADRYCDTTCNKLECGFDTGDCGIDNYNQLYRVDLLPTLTNYTIPKGETVIYFNLTTLVGLKGLIDHASYNQSSVIRTAAVGNKFRVMTLVLHPNHNQTLVTFTLQGHKGNTNDTVKLTFNVTVETHPVNKKAEVSVNETLEITKANKTEGNITQTKKEVKEIKLEDIPKDLWNPKAMAPVKQLSDLPPHVNLSAVELPEPLAVELNNSRQQLMDGEITQKGFIIQQQFIWQKFQILHGQNPEEKNDIQKNPVVLGSNSKMGQRRLLGLARSSVVMEMDQNGYLIELDDGNIEKEHLRNIIINDRPFASESNLPWEKDGVFNKIHEEKEKLERSQQFTISPRRGRRLLDTFGDSLRHVNKLFNKAFGYSARKVPGHMPHMMDKDIMNELQDMFPEEWAVTSSHKIRSSDDMQFAFSYYYYLMGVTTNVTIAQVFDEMDTDKSRVLSDREIRTLATRLFDLPLNLPMLVKIEDMMRNCSTHLPEEVIREYPPVPKETYYEEGMPQVTRNLFTHCEPMIELVHKNFKPVNKYSFTIMDDAEIAFKMIKSNISTVVGQLDDIRKHPKKFICLNDNIEHNKEDAQTVKAILQDFYEAVFPIPSQFELPREYRNRFLHADDLREWRKYRDWLKFWTHLALAVLVIFTVASFFADKIEAAQKRLFRRRPKSTSSSAENETSETSSGSGGGVETV
ncbi:N-acetylglucosamine-1-phosphotransferase subunits alpha/beta-like isoform X2 [Mizuhopecten yessoensis]|uniref:N-acetylglucosamine-1-phosphotransferase subunits alpha/beta n=1 Tax=Mizuhopecten yessoensis TaxID=6573 RepID=A0A210QPT3_MIZYE|nr:N-acetylglucosamine-1-phosphotransferase subunits alpha/beta-like isoform X2 [Mizuhopecten yessoensis]OWF50745.1 N-acetylglucosamine-1-phosphotransferase subunits alpha/beta [Mizuhopecten yessoensis]